MNNIQKISLCIPKMDINTNKKYILLSLIQLLVNFIISYYCDDNSEGITLISILTTVTQQPKQSDS